jgi:hypothetical protein
MLRYELTPAATVAAPRAWPSESKLRLDPARPTMVVFVHPQCPCSRASLNELLRLADEYRGRFLLQIVFVEPHGWNDQWTRSRLWKLAEQIPDATVCTDESATEADRFDATTSGEALVYGSDGSLLFHGGLTASRGHEGGSPGRAAIASILEDRGAQQATSPVFGCALTNRCCPTREQNTSCNP